MNATNILSGTPISASRFTWEGTEGVAELSDFTNDEPAAHQVYADACDWGLTLISPASGKEEIFVHVASDFDKEHELLAHRLESINPKTGRPDGRLRLVLLND